METNNQTPITDDARRFADTKKLVLTPLHADIAPEVLPESEAVVTSNSVLANIPSDTEHEDTILQPSRGITEGSDEPAIDRATSRYLIGMFVALALSAVAIIFVVIR